MAPLPAAVEIWNLTLPSNTADDALNLFYTLLAANLPEDYSGYLYKRPSVDGKLMSFLADAAMFGFPRVASILGLLQQMAGDSQFDLDDREHVDLDKIKLFWDIIGNGAALDAATQSGRTWPKDMMKFLQDHASRIFDDCHLYASIQNCETVRAFYGEGVAKENTQKVFDELKGMLLSPLNLTEMGVKVQASDAIEKVKKDVYSHFIKLGALERSYWPGKPPLLGIAVAVISNEKLECQSAIPKTKECIAQLCEELYMSQVGKIDETVRAKIKKIPEEITTMKAGFRFTTALEVQLFSGLGGLSLEELKRIPPEFTLDIVWGPFMELSGNNPIQKRKGAWFIGREARAMDVWR